MAKKKQLINAIVSFFAERKEKGDLPKDPFQVAEMRRAMEEVQLFPLSDLTKAERSPADAFAEAWVPPGQYRMIHGLEVPGPLYIGDAFRGVQTLGNDAALIDPGLPVELKAKDHSWGEASVSRQGRSHSYRSFPPRIRGGFLRWMAGHQETVFLACYGLLGAAAVERRVLFDHEHTPLTASEAKGLLVFLARILESFSVTNPFERRRVAHLMEMVSLIGRVPLPETALQTSTEYEALRRQLEISSPPADSPELLWEYCLSEGLLDGALREPGFSADFLRRLLVSEALEHFRKIPKIKVQGERRLTVTYEPFSASLPRKVHRSFSVPNYKVAKATARELKSLCNQLPQLIRKFLRRLEGLDVDPDSTFLTRYILHPRCREGLVDERLDTFIASFTEHRVLTIGDIASITPGMDSSPPAWAMQHFAEAMKDAGYGLHPDLRFEPQKQAPKTKVACFPEARDVVIDEDGMRSVKAAVLGAGYALAEGGSLTDVARDAITKAFASEEAFTPVMGRIAAILADERANFGRLGVNVSKPIQVWSSEHLEAWTSVVFRAVRMASLEHDPGVTARLEKLNRFFGLKGKELYERLHREEHASSKGAANVAIDSERLQRRVAETKAASEVLGAVFAEEEENATEKPQDHAEDTVLLEGLDGPHSRFVLALAERRDFSEGSLSKLAKENGLLLGGAMERINEAAFDLFGDPLIEEGEPFDVDEELLDEWVSRRAK